MELITFPVSVAMAIALYKHKESRETRGTNELQILCMCSHKMAIRYLLVIWSAKILDCLPVLESYILMYLSSWAVTMMGRVG